MRIVVGILSVVFLASTAFAEGKCPVGQYNVKGWRPGVAHDSSPSYTGTAKITEAGDTCSIGWVVGKDAFSGVGFYDPTTKMLSAAYSDTGKKWIGSILYRFDGKGLAGQWAVQGDERTGFEELSPQ